MKSAIQELIRRESWFSFVEMSSLGNNYIISVLVTNLQMQKRRYIEEYWYDQTTRPLYPLCLHTKYLKIYFFVFHMKESKV